MSQQVPSQPVYSTAQAAATHLACAAAVAVACNHNLKFWLAARTLVAPARPAAAAAKPAPPRSRLRRMLGALAFAATEIAVILLISRAATPLILDVFWCAIIFFGGACMIRRTLDVLGPAADRSVKLAYGDDGQLALIKTDGAAAAAPEAADAKADAAPDPEAELAKRRARRTDRLRTAASVLGAAGIVAASYAGEAAAVQPVLTGTFVLAMSCMYFPRVSVRALVKLIGGVYIIVPVLATAIVLVVQAVKAKDGAGDAKTPPSMLQPHAWVLGMMQYGTDGMPFIIASVFLGITARFEHSLLAEPAQAAPGAPAPIPRRAPRCRKPLTAAGAGALALVVALTDAGAHFDVAALAQPCAASNVVLFAGIPAALAAIALAAARRGVFRAWWAYAETYVPKTPTDDEETAVAEVDAALEEKQPLLVDVE